MQQHTDSVRQNAGSNEVNKTSVSRSWFRRGIEVAALSLGGLVGAGSPAAIEASTADLSSRDEHNPATRVEKFDGAQFQMLRQTLPTTVHEAVSRAAILATINPTTTDKARQAAEVRLINGDPGGRETMLLANVMLRELPATAPAWHRVGLERIVLARSLGIEFLSRIPQEHQQEILANRCAAMPDCRPLAIACYPKGDHNGAFYLSSPVFVEMIKAGYRVMYYELETDEDFVDTLLEATGIDSPHEQRAKLLIVAGHGSRTSLHFERTSGSNGGDRGVIDLEDEARFQCYGISRALAEGGHIVLDSCSNGEGRSEMDNIANFFRRIFPQAKHEGIWSATESYGPLHLHFDSYGELQSVEYPVPEYRTHLELPLNSERIVWVSNDEIQRT